MPPQGADGGVRAIFGRNHGLVYPPTDFVPEKAQAKPLDCQLQRDYVFGFNGSIKQSIHFISDRECIYPVAALVIIMDLFQNRQSYFEGHSNDVTCVDWNERRRLCASGQADPKGAGGPFVCIWAPEQPHQVISYLVHPENSRWISAVAFSPDGQTAVSFTGDEACSLFIWRDFARRDGTWNTGRKETPPESVAPLYSASSGRSPINSIYMCPSMDSGGSLFFYTAADGKGKLTGSFSSWTIAMPKQGSAEQPVVSQKRGIFGKLNTPKNMAGIAHSPARGAAWLVAETNIYVLASNSATQSKRIIRPHVDASLGCIATLPDGRWLAGGSDGYLYLGRANPNPQVEECLAIGEHLAGEDAQMFRSTQVPRFASVAVRGDLVLLGTSNHALLLVDLARREASVLQVSHTDAAWGLDFHPSLGILASASIARDVRFWNVADRRPAVGKVLRTERKVWSLAFSPDGALLALGCDQGWMEAFNFPALQPVYREPITRAGERIGDVRFSPNGVYLAAACWDQLVYLLKVIPAPPGGYIKLQLHRTLTGNSSSPLCVMFSADSEIVVSNSKDTQILYWRSKDGSRQATTSAFRDTQWQVPWTGILGWPVIGVWGDPDYDGTDVKSVCQGGPNGGYLASGDDYGNVKLMRFPNPFLEPPCQVRGGHASMVTRVRFSKNNILASLGGDDHSISLWSLAPLEAAKQVQLAERMVHPWSGLQEEDQEFAGAGDRYGRLGQAGPPPLPKRAEPPYPPRPPPQDQVRFSAGSEAPSQPQRAFDDPWAGGNPSARDGRLGRQAGGGGGGGEEGRRRASSAAAVRSAAPNREDRDREQAAAAVAAGARRPDPSRRTPGGRAWESNLGGGVRDALSWN